MGKKFKTPGQIRKLKIKLSCFALAFTCLVLAYFTPGPAQLSAIELQQDHLSAPITITAINEVEEESRGRRGRKTIKNVIYLDYQYQAENQTFKNTITFSEGDFMAFQNISEPEVWFHKGDARNAKLAGKVKADAAKKPIQRVFSVGMIALPILYVLNIILGLLFGREPKGYMPEGFYTEDSWLDIEDNYLIKLKNNNINIVAFDKKMANTIQTRYQNCDPFDDVIKEISVKQTIIPLDSITCIESDHFRDTIYIEYATKDEEESKSLEFLNATVKAHALEKISEKLSTDFSRSDKQFTRFDATKWRLVLAMTFAAITFYYADMIVVLVIGTIASLYFVKSLFARLIDPTLRTKWTRQEA